MIGRGVRAAALVGAALFLSAGGCGPKTLSPRSSPFPAGKPLFVDSGGAAASDLPAAAEPVRLVLLDFPWCPPCAETWKAIRDASRAVPPGSTRVYRVLFDRQQIFLPGGRRDDPPLRPIPPADGGAFPVTTLTAVPDAFRKLFRVEQAPVLLLLSRDGVVVRRWTGYSPALSDAIADEVRRLSSSPLPPGT